MGLFHRLFHRKSAVSSKPLFKKERYGCPFYGFIFHRDSCSFTDSQGKQCGFSTPANLLCHVEHMGDKPDWSKCPFNNPRDHIYVQEFQSCCLVFPKEFGPKGLSFAEWMEYVMRRENEL